MQAPPQPSAAASAPPHADAQQLLAEHEREVVKRIAAVSSFLIFYQDYLVAPLIPSLTKEFHASDHLVGLLVPAYLLPYGLSTLFYGPLSDRIGRRRVLLAMFFGMILASLGMASAHSIATLLLWRIIAGLVAGGVIPISLALFGDLFPYAQRGRAIGWIFGAIAGGMAFGSTGGAMLNPLIGWRIEYLLVAVACIINFLFALRHQRFLEGTRSPIPPTLRTVTTGYLALIRNPRGARGYFLIFCNGIYQAGLFSWLGLYFFRRFHLGDQGIGLALLGYGIPGMLLGPVIGRIADRLGRHRIIPLGLALSALAGFALASPIPLIAAAITATFLSLGYDMSHPLLAGIITSIDPARRGQAMGLNAFSLFIGFGTGALLFQTLLTPTLTMALLTFATAQLLISFLSAYLLKNERPARS